MMKKAFVWLLWYLLTLHLSLVITPREPWANHVQLINAVVKVFTVEESARKFVILGKRATKNLWTTVGSAIVTIEFVTVGPEI